VHQAKLSGFGGSVVDETTNSASEGRHGTIYDNATGTLLPHSEHSGPSAEKEARQMSVQDLVPSFQRCFKDILATRHPSVADQNIDAPKVKNYGLEHSIDFAFHPHIGWIE
jgi:hypothetical protein